MVKKLCSVMLFAVMAMFSVSSSQITLPPIFILSHGSVAGTISDSLTGAPIKGAKVMLLHNQWVILAKAKASSGLLPIGHWSVTPVDSAVSDANGSYSFASVDTLTQSASTLVYYSITATAANYDTSTSSRFGVASLATTTVDLRLLATSIATTTIAGTIFDSLTLTPVNQATIKLIREQTIIIINPVVGLQKKSAVIIDTLDSTQTNAYGKYEFANLAAGSYKILATGVRYDTTVTPFFSVTAASLTEKDTILAPTGGAIEGTVIDSTSKSAIAGAKIVLIKNFHCGSGICLVVLPVRVDSTVSDASGNFTLANEVSLTLPIVLTKKGAAILPIQTSYYYYTLSVSANGYDPVAPEVGVVSKSITDVSVSLLSPTAVRRGAIAGITAPAAGTVATKVVLYDVAGRIVYSNSGRTALQAGRIPLSMMARGKTYVAEITTAAGVSRKLICNP
jgi:hypothetical protein